MSKRPCVLFILASLMVTGLLLPVENIEDTDDRGASDDGCCCCCCGGGCCCCGCGGSLSKRPCVLFILASLMVTGLLLPVENIEDTDD